MRTVVLSGVSQRGKQKIQLHGEVWEVVKEEMGRFLLTSSGPTFHVGNGVMEHDWRFVQLHGDKDFKIEIGKGQATAIKIAGLLPADVKVTLLDGLRNDRQSVNLKLQSLKGGRR